MSFDLPTLPQDWSYAPLDTCCQKNSITYGVVQPGAALISGKPLIRVNNFRDRHLDLSDVMYIAPEIESKYGRTRLCGGEVLLTVVGSVGQVVVVPKNLAGFNVARAVAVIHPLPHIAPDWIAICLRSPLSQQLLGSRANTTVQTTINLKDVRALPIPLPPEAERQVIAEFVCALDDRITLLRETNATLEAIAQALFKSWFVDFDPVRAKMEGRAPEGMIDATAALFPDGFEESALGLVPRGWRIGRVDDLGEVVCGKTPPTSVAENYGNEIPFITIPDMHNLLAVTSTARSLSQIGADSQKKKYLPAGSICVSCIATPGLVVRVTTPAQTNQQINSVIPHSKWGKAFSLFLLRRIGDAVRSNGSGGSVFHNLSKSGFELLAVLLTTPELAQHFDDAVESLVEKIIENQKQAQTLATLRDTLLPRLISGALRLPHSEEIK